MTAKAKKRHHHRVLGYDTRERVRVDQTFEVEDEAESFATFAFNSDPLLKHVEVEKVDAPDEPDDDADELIG